MRDLADADGRLLLSSCEPASVYLTTEGSVPWSLGEDLHVYSRTHVGGLGDVLTACVLAVCLAPAQKVLSLTLKLFSQSSMLCGNHVCEAVSGFLSRPESEVGGGCQRAVLCLQLAQPCPEAPRK